MPTNQRPYPYDAILNGTGVMLANTGSPGAPSLAWSEKRVEDLNPPVRLTEDDLTYAQYPPAVEYPYAVTDLSGGFGLPEQDPKQRDRYWYAEYADCSSGWATLAPRMHSVALTASAGVTQFIEFNSVLYFAAGRYLYKFNDGTPGNISTDDSAATTPPTPVKDFGAGYVIGQMCVFQGTHSASLLFIPISGGATNRYWTMNAAESFTQRASLGGSGDLPRNFETIGDELWQGGLEGTLWVIRKSTDGGTAATWGSATTIGDPSGSITWLRACVDRLFVLKTNGLFAPTVNGPSTLVDEDIAPHLRQFPLSNNGIGAVDWNGELVFKYGHGLYGYQPIDGSFRLFGPETVAHHRSPISGDVAAVAVQTGMALYACQYDNTDTFLMKYGTWKLIDTSDGPKRIFKGAWNGYLYKWASKSINCMWTSYLFSPNNQPRLFFGFSDGTVSHCRIPRTALARDDSAMHYNITDTSVVYYPRFTGNIPVENKLLRALGVFGRELTVNRKLTISYKIASDSSYTAVGSDIVADPGTRQALAPPVSSKAFDIKIGLISNSVATSPMATAVVVYSAVQSQPLREIRCVVKDADKMKNRNGTAITTKSARQMHAAMETVGTSTTGVTVITPYGQSLSVIGLGYEHRLLGWDSETGNPREETSVHMVTTT